MGETVGKDDGSRTRGFIHRPMGDECRRGHLDWEVVSEKGKLIKRCRQCGDIRPFEGERVEP